MEFNPNPTQQKTEIFFSSKNNSPEHPQSIFNGSVVVKVNEQRHFGLILELGLSFEKHLSVNIIKAKRNIGILKHLSKFLLQKTFDQRLLFVPILIIVMPFITYHQYYLNHHWTGPFIL